MQILLSPWSMDQVVIKHFYNQLNSLFQTTIATLYIYQDMDIQIILDIIQKIHTNAIDNFILDLV